MCVMVLVDVVIRINYMEMPAPHINYMGTPSTSATAKLFH